jgi:plastocyanin
MIRFITLAFIPLFVWASVASAQTADVPDFDEAIFTNPTNIDDNPWISFAEGRTLIYEGETSEGTERTVVEVTNDTKTAMGITARVVRDRVFLDGELIEDTRDYLAEDDEGNIWYLGEDVDNYENGRIANHDGSWLAGRNGAQPGYWLPADPVAGDVYYQEFLEGEAEDQAEVMSLSTTVQTEMGTFTNCLKTMDTTALEPGVVEFKSYCKQVGALALEETPAENERAELVQINGSGTVMTGGEDEDEDESGDIDQNDDDDMNQRNEAVDGGTTQRIQALQERLISLLHQLIALIQASASTRGPGEPTANDEETDNKIKTFDITAENFKFSNEEIRVNEGDTVRIRLSSEGGTHDLVIDEFNSQTKRLSDGESDTISFVADRKGTFAFYCSVGNHRQMGMEGNLIVE